MQSKTQLTIATYNIELAINEDTIIKDLVSMAKAGVSVFCLQELISIENEEFTVNKILRRLGSNWQAAYNVGTEFSKLSLGTCIVWDTTMMHFKKAEKIFLPKIKKFDHHEKFYYRLLGIPPLPLQRKVTTCYFEINQKKMRITSVHLDNVGGPKHRKSQFSYLMRKLNDLETPYYDLICGDFNTFDLLSTGTEKKTIQKILGNEYIDASKQVGWTSDIYNIDFRTSIWVFPFLIKKLHIHIRKRLDYIWGKNIEVLTCAKQNYSGSDHKPIIARINLKS